LSFIRRARDLGFSIEQVRALLDLSDDKARDCATIDSIAREHLREVDRKVADLTALRRELSSVIASCGGGTVAECRIIEALGPDANNRSPPNVIGSKPGHQSQPSERSSLRGRGLRRHPAGTTTLRDDAT